MMRMINDHSYIRTVRYCVRDQSKILRLQDIDLDGKEWNIDFFQWTKIDETLLGLFKLGGIEGGYRWLSSARQ
jgi:hypothetical protein